MPIRGSLLLLGLALVALPAQPETAPQRESVVLLHGMGRGPWAMKVLGHRLGDAGYRVYNLGYPRRADSIDEAVAVVRRQYLELSVGEGGPVHFVTHSLGGLVVRAYLAEHEPANLGRVVMLAPPNSGSEIVGALGHWQLLRAIFGPLAVQLGTGPGDLPATLPDPTYDVGVIAGDRWINPLGPLLLPQPHDGTVSVEGTRLTGMADHLVVPSTHTFIMNSQLVADQVVRFLRSGRFARGEEDEARPLQRSVPGA